MYSGTQMWLPHYSVNLYEPLGHFIFLLEGRGVIPDPVDPKLTVLLNPDPEFCCYGSGYRSFLFINKEIPKEKMALQVLKELHNAKQII
jgi:hypothetical protein